MQDAETPRAGPRDAAWGRSKRHTEDTKNKGRGEPRGTGGRKEGMGADSEFSNFGK